MSVPSMGLGLFITVALAPGVLGQTTVHGVVYEDRNGNGTRESGERGIAGVVVSNQADCVATGDDGTYELDAERGHGIVFVSVPATHRPVGSCWTRVSAESPQHNLDFALAPTPKEEAFSFIHASDAHLNEKNLPRFQRLRKEVNPVVGTGGSPEVSGVHPSPMQARAR